MKGVRSQVILAAALLVGAAFPAAVPAFAQGAYPGLPRREMPPPSISASAHARYSKAPINLSQPDLPLLVAMVDAGGGVTAFDADKLIRSLTGDGTMTQAELAVLSKKFGAENVMSFEKTFDFVASDALAQAAKTGIALPSTPAPSPSDPKALAAALYAAGRGARDGYDVEYMLDSLVSHIIHVQVMNDIDANPAFGPAADANYHLVLAQVMLDLKKTYAL